MEEIEALRDVMNMTTVRAEVSKGEHNHRGKAEIVEGEALHDVVNLTVRPEVSKGE